MNTQGLAHGRQPGIDGLDREREVAGHVRCAGEHAGVAQRQSTGQAAREDAHGVRGVSAHDDPAVDVGLILLAILQVLDHAQRRLCGEAGHLRTDEFADYDLGCTIHVLGVAVGIGHGDAGADAVEIVQVGRIDGRIDLVAHRLAILAVDRVVGGSVAVELVTPGRVLGWVPQRVGQALEFLLHCVAVGVGLQEFPLRLHLVGLLVLPIRLAVAVGVVRDQVLEHHLVRVVGDRLDDLHPTRFTERLAGRNRDDRCRDGGHHLCRLGAGRRRVGEPGCAHLNRRTEQGKATRRVVHQPGVDDRARRPVVADPKMLAALVHGDVCAGVSLWRREGRGRLVREAVIRPPGPTGILGALVADEHLGVQRVGVVLANFRHAVVIPVEGVGDVRAVDVVDFDFEPVRDLPGVVHRVEVVQVADDGRRFRKSGTKDHHEGDHESLESHGAVPPPSRPGGLPLVRSNSGARSAPIGDRGLRAAPAPAAPPGPRLSPCAGSRFRFLKREDPFARVSGNPPAAPSNVRRSGRDGSSLPPA